MKKGYSYDDLDQILYQLNLDSMIVRTGTDQCSLSVKTSYNLTNLLTYVAEKIDDGDSLCSDLVDCGMDGDQFLEKKTGDYTGLNTFYKSDILRDLCISNAFSFGMWISKALAKLNAISD